MRKIHPPPPPVPPAFPYKYIGTFGPVSNPIATFWTVFQLVCVKGRLAPVLTDRSLLPEARATATTHSFDRRVGYVGMAIIILVWVVIIIWLAYIILHRLGRV